jgi:hypothetical protein
VLAGAAERLPELYLYRYVTPPRTLFRDVSQLLAGQTLRFVFDGRKWRTLRGRLRSHRRRLVKQIKHPLRTAATWAALRG